MSTTRAIKWDVWESRESFKTVGVTHSTWNIAFVFRGTRKKKVQGFVLLL